MFNSTGLKGRRTEMTQPSFRTMFHNAFRSVFGRPDARRTARTAASACGIESLERKTMPAASVQIEVMGLLGEEVLHVQGTDNDDIISIDYQGTDIVAEVRDDQQNLLASGTFLPAEIDVILVKGFDGNDLIVNNTIRESRLLGGNGNDIISGGWGDDNIQGGGGSDLLFGNTGDDLIAGYVLALGLPVGTDPDAPNVLNGGHGEDQLYGGVFNDHLVGGDDDDLLYGHDGNDTLDGGNGDDELYGGNGNDTLNGHAGIDKLFGDLHNDTLNGGTGGDIMRGGHGDDTMNGDSGDDVMYGGTGEDIMNGGVGEDILLGGDDDDFLNGGYDGSVDTLDGGQGNDLIVQHYTSIWMPWGWLHIPEDNIVGWLGYNEISVYH